MKKLLICLACVFGSFAKANTLECENNYSLFEKIINTKSNAFLISDEDEILEFLEKYDYSSSLNDKHPNKKFWITKNYDPDRISWTENEWIDEQVYTKRIKQLAKYNSQRELNPYSYELLDFTYNASTQKGEICIIPVQAYQHIDLDGEEVILEAMLIDNFFVRDVNSDQWRVLEYGMDFKDKDLYEFFPDLPKHIKNELNDGTVEAQTASEVY